MTAYEKVKAARDPARPTATDYINSIFTAFTEMHGDRRFSDDAAVVTGLALLGLDAGDRHRAGEGARHQRACGPELRLRTPGGVPESAAPDEAGGKIPPGRLYALSIRRALTAASAPKNAGRRRPSRKTCMKCPH